MRKTMNRLFPKSSALAVVTTLAVMTMMLVMSAGLAAGLSLDSNEYPGNFIVEKTAYNKPGALPFMGPEPLTGYIDVSNNPEALMIDPDQDEGPYYRVVLAQPMTRMPQGNKLTGIVQEGTQASLPASPGERPARPGTTLIEPEALGSNMFARPELTPEQDRQFRQAVEDAGGAVLNKIGPVPAAYTLAFETLQQVEAFENHPMVYRMYLEAFPTLSLYQSRAEVGADLAAADFNAGTGIKIGIIDSGIDSQSPGLLAPGLIGPDGEFVSRVASGDFFGGAEDGGWFLQAHNLFLQPWQAEEGLRIPIVIPDDWGDRPFAAQMIYLPHFSYADTTVEGSRVGPDLDLYLIQPNMNDGVEMSVTYLATSARDGWQHYAEEIYLEPGTLTPGVTYYLLIKNREGHLPYFERVSTDPLYAGLTVQEPLRFSVYAGPAETPQFMYGEVTTDLPVWPQGAIQRHENSDLPYRLGEFSYNGDTYQFVLSDAVETYEVYEDGEGLFSGWYSGIGWDSISVDTNGDGDFSDWTLTREFQPDRDYDNLGLFHYVTGFNWTPGPDHWIPVPQAGNHLFEDVIPEDGPTEGDFTLGVTLHSFKRPRLYLPGFEDSSTWANGDSVLFTEWEGIHTWLYPGPHLTFREPFDHANHGTHVAGIAAGGDELPGIAYGSTIHNSKVFGGIQSSAWSFAGCSYRMENPDGTPLDPMQKLYCASWETTDSNMILSGMRDARNNGAKVISMSLGAQLNSHGCYEYFLPNAVDDFVEITGIPVVASAGNSGIHGDGTIGAPACARNVIAVGATDRSGQVAVYSSRGPVDYDGEVIKPDLVAPGGDPSVLDLSDPIYLHFFPDGIASLEPKTNLGFTAVFNQYDGNPTANQYQRMSGTSMAAPHVTGAVAMMLARNPDLSPAAIQEILHRTATDIGESSNAMGYGKLNVYDAVEVSLGWPTE